jgi:hypothetical protein
VDTCPTIAQQLGRHEPAQLIDDYPELRFKIMIHRYTLLSINMILLKNNSVKNLSDKQSHLTNCLTIDQQSRTDCDRFGHSSKKILHCKANLYRYT